MHIFIDECGSFQLQSARVCGVAAIMIPSTNKASLFRQFTQWKAANGIADDEEHKGSKLTAKQAADVLGLLREHDVIFDVAAVHMADKTKPLIFAHQRQQVTAFLGVLDGITDIDGVTQWHKHAADMLSLSPTLYIKFRVALRLVRDVLQSLFSYHALRHSSDLTRISWMLDRPGDFQEPQAGEAARPSTTERLYRGLVAPMVKFVEERRPEHEQLAFELGKEWNYQPLKATYGNGSGIDLDKLLTGDLSTGNSMTNLGLQLAEITASIFYRALNNNLEQSGWVGLGSLMIRKRKQLTFVEFEEGRPAIDPAKAPFNIILEVLNRHARDLRFMV